MGGWFIPLESGAVFAFDAKFPHAMHVRGRRRDARGRALVDGGVLGRGSPD